MPDSSIEQTLQRELYCDTEFGGKMYLRCVMATYNIHEVLNYSQIYMYSQKQRFSQVSGTKAGLQWQVPQPLPKGDNKTRDHQGCGHCSESCKEIKNGGIFHSQT